MFSNYKPLLFETGATKQHASPEMAVGSTQANKRFKCPTPQRCTVSTFKKVLLPEQRKGRVIEIKSVSSFFDRTRIICKANTVY